MLVIPLSARWLEILWTRESSMPPLGIFVLPYVFRDMHCAGIIRAAFSLLSRLETGRNWFQRGARRLYRLALV